MQDTGGRYELETGVCECIYFMCVGLCVCHIMCHFSGCSALLYLLAKIYSISCSVAWVVSTQ